MFYFFNGLITFLIIVYMPTPAFARCAVCYTNGLSGASIAVIVIISFSILNVFWGGGGPKQLSEGKIESKICVFCSVIFLFFGNKILKKFLDRNNI